MKHRLHGLRGQNYVSETKRIIAKDGDAIRRRFAEILVLNRGKFTPNNLGELAVEFRLPLAVLDDYLPTLTEFVYPSGTWQRLKDRGCKARDIGVVWE